MNRPDAEMPGAWKCDCCGLVLQKNVLYVGDGLMSADTSPLNEKCPNDGKLMRPLTWREVNEELYEKVCVLSPIARAASELESYLGAHSGPTADWEIDIKCDNQQTADEVVRLLMELKSALAAWRNP